MITADDLSNRMQPQEALTERQREVRDLAARYYELAREWPSAGWIARQLHISRQRARQHLRVVLKRRG